MKPIVCMKCKNLVRHNSRQLVGCHCDPDAPTWIAIEPDGRILKMSGAEYMTLEGEGDGQTS
jgi:hypothetical protein